MPENPKQKNDKEKEAEKSPRDKCENDEKSSSSQDIRQKRYYYDDAHGYEIYNPETEDKDDEEDD